MNHMHIESKEITHDHPCERGSVDKVSMVIAEVYGYYAQSVVAGQITSVEPYS